MTKRDLATLSGVSPSFLSDVLNGKSSPSLRVLEDIANAFEVSLPLLLEQDFPLNFESTPSTECVAGGGTRYNHVFVTNVSRLMGRRGMTKKKLTVLSGVSPAFLSDVLNGKGNPSLQVMEDIAKALEVPLPSLLEQHVEYSHVFVTNVSRLMTKLGITEESLANLSGTSLSLLSEILIERRSPSLQVSEDIAKALEAPLLLLFDKNFSPDFISIPEGECITVMLPPFQASVVKKWAKAAQSKLHKP